MGCGGRKLDRWRTLPKEEFEHKLTGFLARRGFDYETVRRTVRRAWANKANEPCPAAHALRAPRMNNKTKKARPNAKDQGAHVDEG